MKLIHDEKHIVFKYIGKSRRMKEVFDEQSVRNPIDKITVFVDMVSVEFKSGAEIDV